MVPKPPDGALWQDVCLASAWLHRAQSMHNNINNNNKNNDAESNNINNNNNKSNNDASSDETTIVTTAEKALTLYQSCHKKVKKLSAASAHRKKILHSESSSSKKSQSSSITLNNKNSNVTSNNTTNTSTSTSTSSSSSSNNRAFTINLELRMAQTLRFLALIHAAAHHSAINSTNNIHAAGISSSHTTTEMKFDNHHLEEAIKYHDMAVSLLVGVYDEEEEEEEEESVNVNVNVTVNGGSIRISSRNNNEESKYNENGNDSQETIDHHGEQEILTADSFSEEEDSSRGITSGSNNNNSNNNNNDREEDNGFVDVDVSRVMLTISLPKNDKLYQHTLPSSNDTSTTTVATSTATTPQAATRASFLIPTEDERVRAIAVSLNAMAELHAKCGDDRAAMDSYREALEILRAATEEEEGEGDDEFAEEESTEVGGSIENSNASPSIDAVRGSPTKSYGKTAPKRSPPKSTISKSNNNNNNNSNTSPVQADLANTLMNVGNFHLRRDELDAALNAFSTVWALHSGSSTLDNTNEHHPLDHVDASETTKTASASIGGSFSTNVSLPYLNAPQGGGGQAKGASKTLFGNGNGGVGGMTSSASATSNNNDTNNDTNNNPSISSPGALVALNNLGIVHERRSELHEALSCFEYVHRARLENLGHDHFDTVNALLNIGNCYQRMQEWEKGGMAYEESVRIYRVMLLSRRRTTSSGRMGAEEVKDRVDLTMGAMVRLHRSLAGALRNWGTCYWKQCRISEAIDCLNGAVDVEGKIVTFLSTGGVGEGSNNTGIAASSGGIIIHGGAQDIVRQAKESMAQLLGLLGCLYLEYKLAPSYDKSEESFRMAIQLYEELGYDAAHPSIVWARHNLVLVGQARAPPPPPPTPPPMKPSSSSAPAAAPTTSLAEDVTHGDDGDDNDSAELDRALETDDDGDDDDSHDDIFANSTDELDRILSEEAGAIPSKENVVARDADGKVSLEGEAIFVDEAVLIQSNPEHGEGNTRMGVNSPVFLDEVNFDDEVVSNHEHMADQGQVESHHNQDDDLDERVSQLQLQTTGSNESDTEAAHAHVALAEHFWEKGDRVAATEHYTEAHMMYQSQLGDNSEYVAMVLKRLGDLNLEDGTLDAAKELYGAALEMELTVHGQYLPQTLNAAGAACLKNDDFRSAMEFHRRALQIQKKSPQEEGKQSSKYEMYETLVRIGNVYYSERNNFAHIQSNGVDYGEFIQSGFLGWIANAHDMRGEYIKAIHFYEESLQISMSQKGKKAKRETALTLNRLGSLTRELGRYDEAMDYHQKALNIQKSGSPKAMTAETCVLMGMVKCKIGEFKSALNLYEDSLLVLKNALGEDHSSSWKTMAQIGSLHFELSNYEQSMAILLEAERWQLSSVGEEDRDTLETQALIGRVLSATGQYEMALVKLTDVCEKQRKLFGSKHPTISDTLTYIGECFLDQEGMATEARLQFVECYNMRKEFFASDQIHIAESMVDIIRARSGQPDRALAIYRNAMEVYKEYLSDDHVLIGRLLVFEGDSHAELHDFSTAIERYEQAKSVFSKAFGGECAVDSALVAVNIGKVLLRKCDYDSAKTSFTSALDIYQQILPEGHPKITSALNHLDRVEQEEALCV